MYDVWQFSIYEVSFSLSLIQLWYLIYNKKKKKKKTHLSNCIRHVDMVASQLFWKKIFILLSELFTPRRYILGCINWWKILISVTTLTCHYYISVWVSDET